MNKLSAIGLSLFLLFTTYITDVQCANTTSKPVQALDINSFPEIKKLNSLLSQPESEMDLAKIKLTIDKTIDPSINIAANLKKIDNIVIQIKKMLGSKPSNQDKLLVLKKYLYEKGAWNQNRPYEYDFNDPLGTKLSNKLLPNYLSSRKGNCVSMPFLFIILGQRLGIDVTASTAPLHFFVKYTDSDTGITYNLETTSGANPTRDEWYREQMPMTDEAVKNGIYLKKLSIEETAAAMAEVLGEHYKYDPWKSIGVADVILSHYKNDVSSMLRIGNAFYILLDQLFLKKYPNTALIPDDKKGYFQYLSRNNQLWYARAESLGWREPTKEEDEKYLNTLKHKQ